MKPAPGADPRLSAFVRQLRRSVLEERDAQRRQIEAQWARPLPERLAAGHAIEGVRYVGRTPNGLLELACARNHSRFREGDALCLHRGSPFFQPSLTLTLEADEETRLLAYVDEGELARLPALAQQPEGWLVDEGHTDLSRFALAALDQAADTLIGREHILPLLMGLAEPAVALEPYDRAADFAADRGLNDDQTHALASAYAADLAWLVQGPPGTGKTRVLAHLAEALATRGERVLVTAFTHRAINQALNTLARVAPETPAVKIGEARRADDLQGVENAEYFDQASVAEREAGYVIGATPFATQTRRLAGVNFDTVIFDEASQITLPLAIMGMLAGKRYIFFGDHKQLPPVLSRQAGAFRESIFATLAGRGFDTPLTETYRLNAVLAAWPSATHYGGQLRPATPEVAARRVEYLNPIERLAEVLEAEAPLVFLDLGHRNATTRSFQEATVVTDLVVALIGAGVPSGEIGVVAPYRAQGREIRSLLRRALPDDDLRRPIIVDTVERMQGQEREVVIVSLTTSHPGFAADLAEFFFQPERLNVAITRPRSKLILVGSRHVLRAEPEAETARAAMAQFRDLLAACAYRSLTADQPDPAS